MPDAVVVVRPQVVFCYACRSAVLPVLAILDVVKGVGDKYAFRFAWWYATWVPVAFEEGASQESGG